MNASKLVPPWCHGGLTGWGLYRFDTLRRRLDLPPLGDPDYEEALEAAQAAITADVLGETFLFALGLVVVAMLVSLWLRERPRAAGPASGSAGSSRPSQVEQQA